MTDSPPQTYEIPGSLNLWLLLGSTTVSAVFLYGASHSTNLVVAGLCALAFSFTANTLFSLLHEAVHGLFSSQRRVNDWAGRLAAAWFPTGFILQRAFHLTHHRNNRSEFEQFDVLHPGDIKWLKYAQWYAILTGLYWVVTILGVYIYCLIPKAFSLEFLRGRNSQIAKQTSSSPYLKATEGINPWIARAECAFSLGFQIVLFQSLDLSLSGWGLCYGAFAINWSSLQYTDHAFSPLDAHNGAWNLRVGWLGRTMFLNYHFHLAHHQNPRAPWVDLPKLVSKNTLRPSFYSVWLTSWGGPRRLNEFPKFK